jgi:hypothetical protein
MGCDEPEMAIGLALGMSSLRRRHPALALWRHDDQGGYLLFHRGRLIDAHIWNSPWEHLVGEQEPGDAELLARSTARSSTWSCCGHCCDAEETQVSYSPS